MIITRLYCGLGNQMFQYSAGLSLAYQRSTVLKLDVSWYRDGLGHAGHERYGLDCFNAPQHFATRAETAELMGTQRGLAEARFAAILGKVGLGRFAELLPTGGKFYLQNSFGFDPEFHSLPDDCLLDGVFQSERFFEPVSEILRTHFTFRYPPPSAVARMEEQIEATMAVAVHFRRGDMALDVGYRQTHGTVEGFYYREAFRDMRDRFPGAVFYVFSDDLDFVKASGICPEGTVWVDCVGRHQAYDALRLMTRCKHFIMANSSFSWWGAWLGDFVGKRVVYPTPWFADMPQHDTRDLCPADWSALPRWQESKRPDTLLRCVSH
jgi:hypothetical protein